MMVVLCGLHVRDAMLPDITPKRIDEIDLANNHPTRPLAPRLGSAPTPDARYNLRSLAGNRQQNLERSELDSVRFPGC